MTAATQKVRNTMNESEVFKDSSPRRDYKPSLLVNRVIVHVGNAHLKAWEKRRG